MTDSTALHITVVSDVVCPWCFIGKRHLEQALQLYAQQYPAHEPPVVQWSAFQLNPDMPLEGMDRGDYIRNKFGHRAAEIMQRMADAGQNAGIEFAFDAIQRQPNTLALHALIAAASNPAQQDAVKQALLDAYFLRGQDLTDAQVVSQAVAHTGLPATVVAQCMAVGGPQQLAAQATDAQWRSMQVQGVPLFVFQHKWALSGAQPPAALLAAMVRAVTAAV
jgi:predicted DsbA family dithiol-disulfide isomerase